MTCRAIVLLLGLCQIWTTRFFIDADGTAYVDIARAWLRGDWAHALNSYWSPLNIWLFTSAFAVFSPSAHWQIPLIHVIAFMGFIAAFAAWEWLTSEWESWKGAPSHPALTDAAGYSVIAWAGLRLTGLGWFNSADIWVMALLIAVTAILVRVRRGGTKVGEFVVLGSVLGTGFLAKTACAAIIPVFLGTLAVLLRSWTDRRILITALGAIVIAAPFVTAISIANGHLTIGDSGRLNYSWHVTGMSVEGYKDGPFAPGPEIAHPVQVLMQYPRVLSFEQHLVGTLPIHADVAWWCEGYPVRLDIARQLMVVWSNIRFCVYAFCRSTIPFLVFICLPFGSTRLARSFGCAWFVWLPSFLFTITYCFVYVELRYLAGPYALIYFGMIAAMWSIKLPRPVVIVSLFAVPALSLLLFGPSFRGMVRQFVADVAGTNSPLAYFNVEIAEAMRRNGLQPGDRVATIGFSLAAAHVGLEQAQIVALVPERIRQDDNRSGRPMVFSFENSDNFWRSSPQVKQRVFAAFQSTGAKWVFADCIPEWADRTGWESAGGAQVLRDGDLPFEFFRKL